MKIKTKEVQRIHNLLNMNFDKVEDFDIAVKLKEIMNVLESKNEANITGWGSKGRSRSPPQLLLYRPIRRRTPEDAQ